ncbi:MAG TPA: flagellar biosynthesis protein FlhB [Rhizomicrobium sp.]
MADDQDKSQQTEEPTQRRLDQAHDRGDVVKSTEVSTFVVLTGGALAISIFGQSTAQGFASHFRVFLEQPDQFTMDQAGVMALLRNTVGALALLMGPVFGLLVAMALGGHLVQHRPVFSAESLKPNFSKLNPLNGLKRMFGMDGISNLVKGLMKIAIVGGVTWMVLWPQRGHLEGTIGLSPVGIAGIMVQMLMKMLIAALSVLAVMAALDYMLQRFRFVQRNRMSKQEIKEEFRQTEGDPMIRARLKQIRNERGRKRMMAAVPTATVVVTNPTHFAVALKYESGKMAAPICVAKGMDALALRIREVAEAHDVPIVEDPPLARALYAVVELDEAVPQEHYKAVAQVIGYVMRITGKLRRN